ncbi:MAG: PhoX family protein [Arcobacteraceae bacterium]|nr:PhoX family protein [Arcobacteraceae bacterium]
MYKSLMVKGLSTALIGLTIVGCTNEASKQNISKTHNSIVFENVPAPVSVEEKKSILASSKVTINGKSYDIGFHTIARTGQKLPSLDGKTTEIFGMVKDEMGNPLKHKDGTPFVCRTSKDGSGPDHTTLHEKDGNLFAITQFECAPGAIYISKLEKTAQGGLKAVATSHISQASHHGGWVHCAGMKTPWGSHLGSEEYESNAKKLTANNQIEDEDGYYNNTSLFFKDGQLNNSPYYYGWTPEVTITNSKGETSYTKHYTLGRFAHELAYVMPDEKTVYLTDDGTNGALFMFIADKKADLSSGTLYAAKLNQKDATNGGKFDISWINLGHADDASLRRFIDKKPKFFEMFDEVKPQNGKCESGYSSINTSWKHECLKVKPFMDMYASRLESRRYAAIKGATTEFRKKEGITLDKARNTLYIAISRIQYGMEDFMKKGKPESKYDIGGNNDIKLKRNDCGGVYSLALSDGQKDTSGKVIDSNYVTVDFKGEVLGKMHKYPKGDKFEGNKCAVDGLAEPDNLTFIDNSDILIIGEDTGAHQIDYIWAYDVVKKDLTRIFTTPYGSETTSPFWYSNIAGNGYLTTVIQHPFGESDQEKADSEADKESWVGVVGPFPILK